LAVVNGLPGTAFINMKQTVTMTHSDINMKVNRFTT
jgi:hypothetical protein